MRDIPVGQFASRGGCAATGPGAGGASGAADVWAVDSETEPPLGVDGASTALDEWQQTVDKMLATTALFTPVSKLIGSHLRALDEGATATACIASDLAAAARAVDPSIVPPPTDARGLITFPQPSSAV